MPIDTEYITQLVIDELVGDITPEDAAILQKTLAEHPAAVALREDIITLLTTGEMEGQKARLEKNITVDRLVTAIETYEQENKKKKRSSSPGTGAAVFIGLIILSAFCFYLSTQKKATPAVVVNWEVPRYKHLTLLLPDSSNIRLDTLRLSHTHYNVHQGPPTVQVNIRPEPAYVQTGIIPDHINRKFTIRGPIRGYTEAAVVTPRGKDYTLILPDGSTVRMNSETYMRFNCDTSSPTRDVYLSGEAYMQVAPDSKRPFRVHLPDGSVQVLGTSFNINTYIFNQTQIALVEGKLSIAHDDDIQTLKPGFAASFASGAPIIMQRFNKDSLLSWLDGKYYYRNTRLQDLGPVLERCYGYKVRIDIPEQANTERFDGEMTRGESITDFLDISLRYPSRYKFQYSFDKDSTLYIY